MVPSPCLNFLPLLLSDSVNLLTSGACCSSSVFHQGSKAWDKFCWRIVREVIAAFNLLDLLAEVHVGRSFSSSLLLEAFLDGCSLQLCWRCLVHPELCPQPQDPLLQGAKSMAFYVPEAACKHKERFHGLVLGVFESRDLEEISVIVCSFKVPTEFLAVFVIIVVDNKYNTCTHAHKTALFCA